MGCVTAPNLTRDQARERAALLDVHSYSVELDLTDGAGGPSTATFASTSTVTFAATPGGRTFVDVVGPRVRRAVLNGTELDVSGYDESLGLALDDLAAENQLVVTAELEYSHTGEGLHRFVDPTDDAVYLYSQFETADAKRMFACFDQPDLKATFDLTVTAPSSWTVLSNAAVATTESADDATRHVFATTPVMSTYLVALVAGPYATWTDSYTDDHGEIPLGLYCRASLAEFMDPERLFAETRQGFGFYHRNFGVPYAFGKYDQCFVPEFNAGAMENAGCVTFLEDYVFRSRVTHAQYERRAETVLHEMAHMWFGDLVTMRWWDDPVAQRVLRDLRLGALPGRGDRVHQRVDHFRHRREVLGLPAGPAALHPPHRRRHPRPAGRGGQLRRHHLRQGCERAQAARRLRGPGAVPGGAAGVLPRARLRQRRVLRPAGGARAGLGPRPLRVGCAVVAHHRAEHAAPGARGRPGRQVQPA